MAAKIVPLSKEDTSFPSKGAIRTISVLPAISKLYGICLLEKLEKEIKEKNILHPNQRGFRE